MQTVKNASIEQMLATKQAVGDRGPIFRDEISGDWFGLYVNSNDEIVVDPICCGLDPLGSATGNPEAPNTVLARVESVVALPTVGSVLNITFTTTNTGAVTLDIEDTGVLPLQKPNGVPLQAGDIVSGQTLVIVMGAGQAFYVLAGVAQPDGTIFSEITLTTTQILAINSTPQPLIPNILTTGLGTVIVINTLTALNNFNTAGYVVAGAPTVQYITSNNDTHLDVTNAWAAAVADTFESATGDGFTPVPVAGEGIEFTTTVSDPTVGDGSWVFQITYRIHQF